METVILFIVILVILILVHEFGHFIAAKRSGIRVDEFGIGFPPRAWGKKFGETVYSVNWLPFGGFVKIFGEDLEETPKTDPDYKRSFVAQAKWKQVLVLSAGIIGNFLFAWLLFSIGLMTGLPLGIDAATPGAVTDRKVLVLDTVEHSPAEAAGLNSGDELLSVASSRDGGVATGTADSITSFIRAHGNEELTIMYRRGEGTQTTAATPVTGIAEGDTAAIGVSLGESGIVTLPPHLAVIEGFTLTANMGWLITQEIAKLLAGAVTLSANFETISGPVGIAGLVGEASALGFSYLLSFTALISINLAIVNLIPFPALDGGRLLFVAVEAITRRRIHPNVAKGLNIAGFALLILLMIAVTIQDLSRIW